MSKVTTNSIVVRPEERFIGATIGEEMMLMDLESGDYINLNSIGAVIWEKLSSPKPVKLVCEELRRDFDVSDVLCKKETLTYLNKLYEKGFIKLVS